MGIAKTVISSFVAGATVMYFADPSRGRRRRAVTRDKILAGWRDVGREFDKAGRDLRNRSQGIASAIRSLWGRSDADGSVLVERVRSRIGRAVSHPHAIGVRAEPGGRIVLEGPVPRAYPFPGMRKPRSTGRTSCWRGAVWPAR